MFDAAAAADKEVKMLSRGGDVFLNAAVVLQVENMTHPWLSL